MAVAMVIPDAKAAVIAAFLCPSDFIEVVGIAEGGAVDGEGVD